LPCEDIGVAWYKKGTQPSKSCDYHNLISTIIPNDNNDDDNDNVTNNNTNPDNNTALMQTKIIQTLIFPLRRTGLDNYLKKL
jgi:hypothetical protein